MSINGKHQIGVYLSERMYNEWKQTGMKGTFVFERGLEATEAIKAGNEKTIQIEKLQKTVGLLNNQLLEIQDHADKLEKANMELQAENLKLKSHFDSIMS